MTPESANCREPLDAWRLAENSVIYTHRTIRGFVYIYTCKHNVYITYIYIYNICIYIHRTIGGLGMRYCFTPVGPQRLWEKNSHSIRSGHIICDLNLSTDHFIYIISRIVFPCNKWVRWGDDAFITHRDLWRWWVVGQLRWQALEMLMRFLRYILPPSRKVHSCLSTGVTDLQTTAFHH